MGVTYIADPTPGRHTAGSASWNETFNVEVLAARRPPTPKDSNVKWKGTEGKGVAQALTRNAHQAMNGLGLCMFTMLTGGLPWLDLVNALTGWEHDRADLLRRGERIQNLRAAFNRREGITPARLQAAPAHARRGRRQPLATGPLKGITRAAARAQGRLLPRDGLEPRDRPPLARARRAARTQPAPRGYIDAGG